MQLCDLEAIMQADIPVLPCLASAGMIAGGACIALSTYR